MQKIQINDTTKKIKLRRRRRSSDSPEVIDSRTERMYFNQQTQAAIVAYQSAVSKVEKDGLYMKEILPAFRKLVENLINIHKFVGLYDSYDDLKNDCINFLFETIYKFDATRGTNAFSYFNVVAKNWLIIKTKQKSLYSKKSVSLDYTEAMSNNDQKIIEDYNTVPTQDSFVSMFGDTEGTVKLLHEIRSSLKTENELSCINSVITIFENIDSIDLLNKSAILLYMRELSGLSPKQLTTAMQTIKRHYKRLRMAQNE
jgi:hypothetical protein